MQKFVAPVRMVALAIFCVAILALGLHDAGNANTNTRIVPPVAPTLLDQHAADCWTGTQDALAEIPSHAIVKDRSSGTVSYVGRRVTTDALDAMFGGPEVSYDVLAFCI